MDATPLAMYNYFIERVKKNLHIVLAMSPIGDAFRNRLRMFPSLINCCTIDWFQVSRLYSIKRSGIWTKRLQNLILAILFRTFGHTGVLKCKAIVTCSKNDRNKKHLD